MQHHLSQQQIKSLNNDLTPLSLTKRVALIGKKFPGAIFTTSLGMEDQALTWAIAKAKSPVKIITLQTGRLFPETIELIKTTKKRFGLDIVEFFPHEADLENYTKKYGLNGFYDSVEARKACCGFRKVAPLKRALKGADAWITGLRSGQSQNREKIATAEWDEGFSLVKINPLADYSLEQILRLIEENKIPVNPLHQRNYPSIGCEPCTRAIKPGEDERAGRWWWEQNQNQECGLHDLKAGTAATDPSENSSSQVTS